MSRPSRPDACRHGEPPVRRTSTVTSDPDEVLGLVTALYGVKRLRLAGDRRSLTVRYTGTDLGPVRLDTLSHTQSFRADHAPAQAVLIARVCHGVLEAGAGDGVQRFGLGDITVASREDRDYDTSGHDLHVDVVAVETSFLRRLADGEGSVDWVTPPEWFGRRLDAQTAGGWLRTVSSVRSIVDEPSLCTALVVGTAARLLAATLLAAMAPPSGPSRLESLDATTKTLHRATAFIENNPDLDIGITEIAAAAHVTPRAIQVAFRRHLDTTPSAHLRRVRLDRVRADLLAADSAAGATVTAIAARWGFTRASRFAQQYRALYGEPPSATLRR